MKLLELDSVSKNEGNLELINNINLTAESGNCIGIKCSEEAGLLLFKIICGTVSFSKGKVKINGTEIQNIKNKFGDIISVVLKDEGLYERLTVNEYLNFFRKINNFKGSLENIKSKLGLLDICHLQIKKLTYSQKKRLSIARALACNAKLILLQEPTLNMDKESASIIREALRYVCSHDMTVVAVSISEEEIIDLGADCNYVLCDGKLSNIVDNSRLIEKNNGNAEISNGQSITYEINKIPAKNGEKIILFNPTEIMFIESLDGTSYINVDGEKYACNMTLNDLEQRLKAFGFFRCHRSYLVNLQMVRELITWTRNSFSIVLDDKNKSSIPLSKGKLNELKDILKI